MLAQQNKLLLYRWGNEAQRDARVFVGSLPGDKIRHVDRDWLHELRISVRKPVEAEPHLQGIREKMITDQSSPAKNVTHRPKVKQKWLACQEVILKHEPQTSPCGSIITSLSYAPQRADSESTPWENLCSTVVATSMMIADESSDGHRKAAERAQSLQTLKQCCTGAGWFAAAMIGDWFVAARKILLRPRDIALPFAALNVRIARMWQQLTTEMFFNGKIASPEHKGGTLVAMVVKQLEKTRTMNHSLRRRRHTRLGLAQEWRCNTCEIDALHAPRHVCGSQTGRCCDGP